MRPEYHVIPHSLTKDGLLPTGSRCGSTTRRSTFRELWKKEGEQDARLNSVERKHEGLEREHNVLTREKQRIMA